MLKNEWLMQVSKWASFGVFENGTPSPQESSRRVEPLRYSDSRRGRLWQLRQTSKQKENCQTKVPNGGLQRVGDGSGCPQMGFPSSKPAPDFNQARSKGLDRQGNIETSLQNKFERRRSRLLASGTSKRRGGRMGPSLNRSPSSATLP